MANSSANVYVDLASYGASSNGLSAPALLTIVNDFCSISALFYTSVDSLPADALSLPFLDSLDYITGGNFITFSNFIGGALVMPNVINISDQSAINVNTLVLTDKTGRGNCSLVSPSGASFQFKGVRLGFENINGNFTLGQEKSGFTWTNTGAPDVTVTLPSGAALGTTALFTRTGGTISSNPTSVGRIWHSTQGNFRPIGSGIILATSGCKIGLVCDGSSRWYPTIEEGTINTI